MVNSKTIRWIAVSLGVISMISIQFCGETGSRAIDLLLLTISFAFLGMTVYLYPIFKRKQYSERGE